MSLPRLFRCTACDPDHEFTADAAGPVTCPKCGTVKGEGDRTGGLVVPLVRVHYEEAHPVVGRKHGIGSGEIACNPGQPIAPGTVRSCEGKAVTCPECRETPAFKGGARAAVIDPRYDLPVVAVDPVNGLVFAAAPAKPPQPKE